MNINSPPLISIIIAVYNGKATLQQCIDSVAKQTYPYKELIIIDGGSKDGTVELLKENSNKFSYWKSEADRGIYNAWNKGLAQAKGEWICFLGADDYFWDAAVLDKMAVHLQGLPKNIRVVYGQIAMVDAKCEVIRKEGEPWELAKSGFSQFMCIPHVGTMHRRSLFDQHGKFDETFHIAGDYELLLRELTKNDAEFTPEILIAGQRLGGISTKTANYVQVLFEVLRAKRMHGQVTTAEYDSQYSLLILWKIFGEKLARQLHYLPTRFRAILKSMMR
jgi:glycosyltransferase involved in cell wall biosynthesis